ncbi:MAG: CBS domain-containing protein [Micrococcales bacterium]|uniref:CBS domain-containing protein n=1 Tax=Phycicoccus sp. TaxID=1902410 RepID=UPI0019B85F31|nr:CBS domain-containing protein [Phycicoccus sp.]MBD3782694.1 CBS domain-containing protein [Micrococcales bacterium]HMM94332.1 CBS domain-containing protein [Phycicoccus sp.]
MRAQDLVEQVPTVTRETTGAEAARVIAEYRLSGLVVADDAGVPIAVIPGSQLFGLVLPRWVRDDRKLVHAYDEKGADDLCRRLNESTIGDLLDDEKLTASKPPAVLPEDTLLEIASAMDDAHSPVILVKEEDGTYRGVLTMSRVLAAIATAAGQDSDLVRRRLERDIILRGTPHESGPTREAP